MFASPTFRRAIRLPLILGLVLLTCLPVPANACINGSTCGTFYTWGTGSWGSCTGGAGTWSYSAWSPATGTYCTSSLTQTRTASCSPNSGTGTQIRDVYCKNSYGTVVANSYCDAATEPVSSESCTPTSGYSCGTEGPTTQTVADYGGCTYAWITSAWSAPSSSCSSSATETRTVSCQRSDGTIVADSYCSASTEPASSQTVSDYNGCTYSWQTSSWGSCTGGSGTWNYTSWSPATGTYCTSSLTQTRTASCTANVDSGSQTRSVSCLRSDGTTVPDTDCSGTAPASSESCTPTSYSCGTEGTTTQTVADYGGCTYAWITSAWSAPSSSCSSSATETRTVSCQRSDGTIVADSYCSASTEPASSQTVAVYSACTYSWQISAWSTCTGGSGTWSYSSWSPTAGTYCTSALSQTRTATCNVTSDSGSQTRTVTCLRSDGTTVPDSDCSGTTPSTSEFCTPTSGYSCGTEGATTQTVADYGGCTYSWQASGFGSCIGGSGTWQYTAWAPTCGQGAFTQTRSATCTPNADSATQTQTVTCLRSDGTVVGSSYCPSSTMPSTTQPCTPTSGYSCGTEGALTQTATMLGVCTSAMTACAPNASTQHYCVVVPLQ